LIVVAALLTGVWPLFRVEAAQLTERSLQLSNNNAGQSASYKISFTVPTTGTLGSVKIEFCDNTALFEEACVAPASFDASGATLSDQVGETGFAIDGASTSNVLILSRTPTASVGGAVSYTLNNIINASNDGSSFARFSTFATDDASGPETDKGSVAYSLNESFSVSTEVPPYLIFCLGNAIPSNDCASAQGDYVNVGDMGPTYTSSGQTQLLTATNAANGYAISVFGGTMTSGNNEIPIIVPGGMSVAGVSQFGINLRANTNPSVGQNPTGPGHGAATAAYNQPNHYRYSSGDVLASSPDADDYRKYTVSYIINVSANQPPGVYASTFTYICLANF
jgi:hypothetical protein